MILSRYTENSEPISRYFEKRLKIPKLFETRSSADELTNLRDAFGGQSRSPNIVPFHMLGIVSYCAIVTSSSRRYLTSKNVMTLKWGSNVTQDHCEWYHSIDCVWFPISGL